MDQRPATFAVILSVLSNPAVSGETFGPGNVLDDSVLAKPSQALVNVTRAVAGMRGDLETMLGRAS